MTTTDYGAWFVWGGWLLAIVLIAMLAYRCREKIAMRHLLRRREKEPVDLIAARLDDVTDRLVSATEDLQRTVAALRNGESARVVREPNPRRSGRPAPGDLHRGRIG